MFRIDIVKKIKKKVAKKKKVIKATFESLKIRCPKTEKIVSVPAKKVSWRGWESECDMCGGHGGVEMDITCSCGEHHDIEVDNW